MLQTVKIALVKVIQIKQNYTLLKDATVGVSIAKLLDVRDRSPNNGIVY